MKDWIGNSNSIVKMLGASNHCDEEREPLDFYATSPDAIDHLLKKVDLPRQILEPACGSGCLSKRLEELGHDVYSSDIEDRGYGIKQDFFSMDKPPFDGDFAIVTNPPYRYSLEFCKHSLELVPEGSLVCMFLKTLFLEGKKRYKELFVTTPPHRVLQFVERALCAKNGDFEKRRKEGTAVAYAWFVWVKGHNGPTILDWI